MPILIEQTPQEIKLAFEVHTNSSIDAVRVASTNWTSASPELYPEKRIRLEFRIESKILPSPTNLLRIEVKFRTEGKIDAAEAEAMKISAKAFSVECAYEFDYLLNEGFNLAPNQAKAFKDGNAIFNAWPFHREFTLNAVQRMGFPALVLPFMRIQPKRQAAAKTGKKEQK